jgi:Protein of unknown function (DUF4038)/Domain of unknown function (DUF5060)
MSSMNRRDFGLRMTAGFIGLTSAGQAQNLSTMERTATEWSFTSGKKYEDPFHEVVLEGVIQRPGGAELHVPAFWAGDHTWRVRFAPPAAGRYTWRTLCTDSSNADLNGLTGTLEAAPFEGSNNLLKHGPVRVGSTRRTFEHADGAPFFWLGDTWWMGLTKRLKWPDDFQLLTADRVQKGFTVVQIVAGLYPDMPQFDPRGANEEGYPWERDYARINPRYFDMADLRIRYLVSQGITPCIVGCWGYYLPILGIEKMKQHWRYLVARWSALPVVWCLAGEGTMPYYLSAHKEKDAEDQKRGWTEIARYVRSIDPRKHMITIHPSSSARVTVEDASVLDFDMLQTGHGDRASIPNTVESVVKSYGQSPRMPVLVGEVCYEGIMEASRQEVQRFMFWASVLSGAAGHTYGANGIWQVNTQEQPFGLSPHGRSWGDTPWEEAYRLPGSRQLGMAKQLLMRYPWPRFEPHPDWVEPRASKQNYMLPYAAGIPGQVRFIFCPPVWDPPVIQQLEPGIRYSAFLFNPATGKEHPVGPVTADSSGNWRPPVFPIFQDWILVLEKA